MIIDCSVQAGDWSAFGDLNDLAGRAIATACDIAAPGLAHDTELSLLFADDALVRRLNRDYRGIDKATNVLSFPQSAGLDDVAGPLLGDIALAQETVLCEALADGKKPADHLTHLIVHGLLHLLGYDHESDEEAETMEQLERRILHLLSIADPYEDAASGGVDAA